MTTAADKAVRAQGGGLVTPLQIKSLIVTAHRAYDAQAKIGMVDDGVDFDTWRRATIHDVVGPAASGSFRMVTQRDYAAVMAYFSELAGVERLAGGDARQSGREGRDLSRTPTTTDSLREEDERRRALWSLGMAEDIHGAAFGGKEGARRYADAIFTNVHHTDRYGATARQVWAVIFTLRNRAASKRAKTGLQARGAAGVH